MREENYQHIILSNGKSETTGKTWETYLSERISYTLLIDEIERKLWLKANELDFPNQSIAFNFLCYLASKPMGTVFKYEDIYSAAWQVPKDQILSENKDSINKSVQALIRREINQLFGSSEDREKYIIIISGKGIKTTANISMLIRMKR